MALTENFKNECERLINAWHPLIQYWWDKGSGYKELAKFIGDNGMKVLDDPFLVSFKTTRTFEEIKWMLKRIQEYYLDEKPTGVLYYINIVLDNPKEPKDDIQRLIYNYYWLRNRFIRNLNDGGFENVNKELETAKQEKETWKTNSEGWRKAVEERDKAIKERDGIITTAQTNLKTANEKITTLTNESNVKDTTIKERNTTISDQKNTIDANNVVIDKLRPLEAKIDALEKQLTARDEELKKRNETITSITNENQTLKGQATQSDKYLNKLLKIYREQITEATQAFYLNDLGLDESEDIRPKYKVDYLMRLNKLNGDIDPEQTINAFKIVALICATDKAQKISDKWINSSISKNKIFRESKLKYFNNIKKYWEINKGIISSTGEENNPLFLLIIDTQDFYRKQIEKIINLWQEI